MQLGEKKKQLVGIVIPFYNGMDFLEKLVSSINNSTNHLYKVEILIVDNSPSSYESEIRKSFPHVSYLRPGANIGYGKASNEGYRFYRDKKFDYVIVSNQDGYFQKSLIGNLLSPFLEDSSILITAPLILTYQDHKVESFFIEYYLKFVPELITDFFLNRNVRDYYLTKGLSGACFAVKLKNRVFDQYLFDPKFHMYYEDVDLCRTVLQSGHGMVLVPKASFYHQHSHTTAIENSDDINLWRSISGLYFRFKNARSKQKIITLYGIFVDQFCDTLRFLLRFRFHAALASIKTLFAFLHSIILK